MGLVPLLIKLLSVLAVLAGGYFLLRKKLPVKKLVLLGAAAALLAAAAYSISGACPPLRDQVTLTALGESGPDAAADQVFLAGYTVDGRTYDLPSDLQVLDGHWFWIGSDYGWRPETDPRRPEGVTRTVTLKIPSGDDRTLLFSGGDHGGMVEIRTQASPEALTADTFRPTDAVITEPIGASAPELLYRGELREAAVFAGVFFALTALLWALCRYAGPLGRFAAAHPWLPLYAAVAGAQFVFAVLTSQADGLWYDELYEIGWSVNSRSVLERAFAGGCPLPIFASIYYYMYKLAPYGERFLLLLPEAATAVGVFFTGMTGRELKDTKAGFVAAVCAMVSGDILMQCSHEARSYGLYFMSAAILLYLYLRSYREPDRRSAGDVARLTVTMVFFAEMHNHAVVFCAMLFCLDLAARFFLRVKNRSVIPYICSAVSYIPIVIAVLRSGFVQADNFWQPVPRGWHIHSLFSYLSGESTAVMGLFFAGTVIILALVLTGKKNREDRLQKFTLLVPVFLVYSIIGLFVVYGNVINTEITLWDKRYFTDLEPAFFAVCGFAVSACCDFLRRRVPALGRAVPALVLGVCLLLGASALPGLESAAKMIRFPNREIADWLYTQGDYIYNHTTLVINSGEPDVVDGWNEYYLTMQGRRDPINVIGQGADITPEELLRYDRVYMVKVHMPFYREDLQETLDRYYDSQNETDLAYDRAKTLSGAQIIVYQKKADN